MTNDHRVRRTSSASRVLFALTAILGACASRPGTAETAASAAPLEGGMLHPVEVRPAVTASSVATTIVNNTEAGLVFHTAIQVVDVGGFDVVPAILGPKISVPAGAESRRWVAGLPPLPDGYHRVIVTAMAFGPGGALLQEGGADGHLKRMGGQTTVIDFGEWYHATGGSPIYKDTETPPDGPSPGERLLSLFGVTAGEQAPAGAPP